jgi:hypothetical protein
MSFWFRHRRVRGETDEEESVVIMEHSMRRRRNYRDDSITNRDHQLLTMAVNHMIALVLIFYLLYAICRFGFGWDPTRDPPPPTYTIHIPGITDDVRKITRLRGSQAFDHDMID